MDGERNSYKVLGLSATTSQAVGRRLGFLNDHVIYVYQVFLAAQLPFPLDFQTDFLTVFLSFINLSSRYEGKLPLEGLETLHYALKAVSQAYHLERTSIDDLSFAIIKLISKKM